MCLSIKVVISGVKNQNICNLFKTMSTDESKIDSS